MTITVNPDLNLVVEQPLSRLPLAVVKLPRGPKVPIWVQFARDGAVIDPSEALTSGTLVVGLYYKITTFVAGDSFTNVGAASNATSVYFLCTGTTPTTWTNSSTLQQCDSAGVLFSLIFSVKKNGEYDGAVLVLATGTDFTKFGTGTSTIFKSKCSFSTAEINTLLGVDASVASDESEVTLMGEVSWLGPDESKAFPFQIDLQNDSYKVNDVVTSTPGVQAMSLVTTSSEALLTGSRVITGSGTVTVTLTTGLVTLSVPSELVVPSQTGNSGKYLTTNGTAASWATVTGGVTSITGTANEITVTGTTTPTLSLPSALTFTGKTITGGTFNSGAFNGTVGATTPSTVAGTTGTFSGEVTGLTFNAVTISHGLSGDFRSIALGDSALSHTTTGVQNTALGSVALIFVTSGSYNTAIGRDALLQNVSGDSNTAIGVETLSSALGSGNVGLGFYAGCYETGSNSLYIDNQDRTNTAGDKAKALLYGTFAATAAAQQLTINAGTITLNGSAVTAASYAGAGTGLTGTAASLTAGNVTTNANLTGHVTSVGNAAVLGSFTMAQLSTAVSDGDPAYVGAANTFTTGQTISSTTSLLLGTAGSAVGNVGFRNATSGTTTLEPATGALGTGTVTLPLSGTLAISSGAQTFTGVQSMTSPAITTSITTPSTTFAIANATATTLNIGGAATTIAIGAATGTLTLNNATINVGGNLVQTAAASSITCGYGGVSKSASDANFPFNNSGTSNWGISWANASTSYMVLARYGALGVGTGFTSQWNGATPPLANIHSKSAAEQLRLDYGTGSNYASFTVGSAGSLTMALTGTSPTFTFSQGANFSSTLGVTGASTLTGLLTTNGGITLGDAQNIAFNTTTGTKIGAATTQKLSFWNATPIVQPTTAVSSATVASPGGGSVIKTDDTFDGYTIAQVVKALRNAGLLA